LSKKEVVDTVSNAIEDQARTTAFMRMAEAKGLFKALLSKMGALYPKAANLEEDTRTELTTIVDFLMERTENEVVWEECLLFRQKVIDEIVTQWKEKKR